MAINNFDSKRSQIQFGKRMEKFSKINDELRELATKEHVITNINVMYQELNYIIAQGILPEDDWQIEILKANISNAQNFLSIPEPSITDVFNCYSSCKNFYDMVQSIKGGDDRV